MHVYYNLTRRCFSIKDPATGLVINKGENTQYVLMRDVVFKVSEKGRQRVLREKRKNVHAYAVGEVLEYSGSEMPIEGEEIGYNPYKAGHFYNKETGKPISYCEMLFLLVKDGKPILRNPG